MAIKTKGPANMKPGTKKGKAPHAVNKSHGFDTANEYAPFAKSKLPGKGGK